MRKRKQSEPLITSIASVVDSAIDTRPFDVTEIQAEKREIHGVLKEALGQFTDKLKSGRVDLSTSLDLERLVKMLLLVMGEPDGVPQTESKQTVVTFAEPLSLDDPDVKSVYDKLTNTLNAHNDAKQ